MSKSNAWLLECGDSLTLAVSDHEIVECFQPDCYYSIPVAPHYCSSVVAWQGRLVPVMNMSQVFGVTNSRQDATFLCLLSYQEAPGLPLQYLGVPINRTPEKIEVDDDQACELAEDGVSGLLKFVALSCFSHLQQAVPIVDIAGMSSAAFREQAQTH